MSWADWGDALYLTLQVCTRQLSGTGTFTESWPQAPWIHSGSETLRLGTGCPSVLPTDIVRIKQAAFLWYPLASLCSFSSCWEKRCRFEVGERCGAGGAARGRACEGWGQLKAVPQLPWRVTEEQQ